MKELPPAAIAGVLLVALLAGLAVAMYWAAGLVSHVEEFGQAADSFGYLQSAKDLRAGHAPHGGEPFTADSPNARALIAHLQSLGLPAEAWESGVAPAAYHYVTGSGKIVNQYPPGAGRLLALWPEGQALERTYVVTFIVIAVTALGAAATAFMKVKTSGSLAPVAGAAAVCLGLHAAVNVMATTVSYSIDFFILIAAPAVALAVLSRRGRLPWGVVLAFAAGAAAGFAVQMRVAAVLLLPGLAALILTSPKNSVIPESRLERRGLTLTRRLAPLAAWLIGALLAGIVPLLIYQSHLTGSPFTSTYARADTAPPSLAALPTNLAHYFGGDGGLLNWALYAAGAAVILAWVAVRKGGEGEERPPAAWWLAPALLFALPTAYFLTHPITTQYYQFPMVETVALALGAVALAWPATAVRPPWDKLVLVAVVIGVAVHVAVALIPPQRITTDTKPPARALALPESLKDPRAWVFANRYSGTLWWSHGVYAMDLMKASPDARAAVWAFLAKRADPVFVVDDRPAADIKAADHPLLAEARRAGAKAERAGEFEEAPVWALRW